MDIQRQTFTKRLRGLDPEEVRTYLNLLAEEVAALQRQCNDLSRDNQSLESNIDEHRQRETLLRNTLLTAQRAAEDIKDTSRKEAEVTLKQAELQADRLLELAQSRAHDVERGILDLHSQREVLRNDVRQLIAHLNRVLDLDQETDQDEVLSFLKRRKSSSAG
jgi:cell division initiation protein